MLTIRQIVFDCDQADSLAAFWSKVLDRPVDEGAAPYFATIGRDAPDGAIILMFIKVSEQKQVKNRLHLDLHGPSGHAELERVIGLGAVRVSEHDEYGITWVTLQDPEGNEFDIATGTSSSEPDPGSATGS